MMVIVVVVVGRCLVHMDTIRGKMEKKTMKIIHSFLNDSDQFTQVDLYIWSPGKKNMKETNKSNLSPSNF